MSAKPCACAVAARTTWVAVSPVVSLISVTSSCRLSSWACTVAIGATFSARYPRSGPTAKITDKKPKQSEDREDKRWPGDRRGEVAQRSDDVPDETADRADKTHRPGGAREG